MNVETDGGERIGEDGSGCMGGRKEVRRQVTDQCQKDKTSVSAQAKVHQQ